MSKITIFSGDHKTPYAKYSHEVRNNKNLDMYARDLYGYLISRPPGWVISYARLTKCLNVSRPTLARSSKLLQDEKFLKLTQIRRNEYDWTTYSSKVDYELDNNQVIKNELLAAKMAAESAITPQVENQLVGDDENQDMADNAKLSTGNHPANAHIGSELTTLTAQNSSAVNLIDSMTLTALVRIDLIVRIYLSLGDHDPTIQKAIQQKINDAAKLASFRGDLKTELIKFQGFHTDLKTEDKDTDQWIGLILKWLAGARTTTLINANKPRNKSKTKPKSDYVQEVKYV